MKVTIYALIDPRNNEPRYIGKTSSGLRIRFTAHLRDKRPSRKLNWIKSILASGLQPAMEALEELPECASSGEWREAESFWISYLRSIGARLTNLTEGGEGFHGLVFTEDHKRKIGDAHLGRKKSPETLVRMSESRKGISVAHLNAYSKSQIGKKMSPEHCARIAAAGRGRTHSSETKAKMSAASIGRKFSMETRRKISEALKKRHLMTLAHGS